MEVTKQGGKQVEHKIAHFVTGFHSLPEAGGLLDQSFWLMEMFDVFKRGENAACVKALSK